MTLRPPARDIKLDPNTVDVERLARFIFEHDGIPACDWREIYPGLQGMYRSMARSMVRDFAELVVILASIILAGGGGEGYAPDVEAAAENLARCVEPEEGVSPV
jgi:hypothetical protein